GGVFEFSAARAVEAKGLPDPLECRTLVRALGLTQPRGGGHLEATFVGRDVELEALREGYRRAAGEGRPFLVSVIGDAGVGKSRLLRELGGWLAAPGPPGVPRHQCLLPARDGGPHCPLRA